jgi:DNA-binding MarR family transcriptional regulator
MHFMDTKFIIHLISRIHDKSNKFLIKELRNHQIKGIAPSHGDILGALCMADELKMKDLAALINKDKSTVTSLVNKLIALGYIEKKSDPSDNRITLIRLSQKGLFLKPEIIRISRKMNSQACRNLSNKDKKILVALLAKINNNF